MTIAPKFRPGGTHYLYLEMARGIHANGGQRILNPRDTTITSLFLADADWLRALNWHELNLRYQKDQRKAKKKHAGG